LPGCHPDKTQLIRADDFVQEAHKMKISTEEVTRLMAMMPSERGENRSQTVLTSPSQNTYALYRKAAEVEMSLEAKEMQQVKKWVDQVPDVREARVRELKAQVDAGTYNVSSEDIADLMLRRIIADNSAL
jgi:negative regulator of flagellin synthesis FlgM